jgi:hypothetical protein
MKLVIIVDGGNVRSIYTDRPDIPFDVDVIDFDNLKAEGFDSIQRYRIMEEHIKNLTLVKN